VAWIGLVPLPVADAAVDVFDAVGEYEEEPGGGITGAHFDTVGDSGATGIGLTVEAGVLAVGVEFGLIAAAALVVEVDGGLTAGEVLVGVAGTGWAAVCTAFPVGSTRGL
jgi:hypothetical protein